MKRDSLDIALTCLFSIIIFFFGFGSGTVYEKRRSPPSEPARFVYLETLSDEMRDGSMMYGICRLDRQEGRIETVTVFSLDAFRKVMKELEVTE